MATSKSPQKKKAQTTFTTNPSSKPATPPDPVANAIQEYRNITADLSGPEPVWCYGKFCIVPVG